jgi:hypothetical protein
MENLHKMKLIGITYNQIESGVYALILEEAEGVRRLPIIIGYPEAQSIECKLQEVTLARPLTHDLMVSTISAYGIAIERVVIRKLPNGVFAADLYLTDGTEERKIDSRASDAVALAIRTGAPIFTYGEVLDSDGFNPQDKGRRPTRQSYDSAYTSMDPEEETDIETLTRKMEQAVKEERYEEAAQLKKRIEEIRNRG